MDLDFTAKELESLITVCALIAMDDMTEEITSDQTDAAMKGCAIIISALMSKDTQSMRPLINTMNLLSDQYTHIRSHHNTLLGNDLEETLEDQDTIYQALEIFIDSRKIIVDDLIDSN